jgi:hypothetical protein
MEQGEVGATMPLMWSVSGWCGLAQQDFAADVVAATHRAGLLNNHFSGKAP